MILLSEHTRRALILAGAVLLAYAVSTAMAGTPTVNGLYYGDGDETNYFFLRAADGARGSVYYNLVGDTLYVLMLLDGSVNDNVFGIRSQGQNRPDGDYLESAGWESGSTTHQAADLIGSDHLQVSVICGDSAWSWRQDYLWDADYDDDPSETDWLSDHLGPDAVAEPGTPPPGLIGSASSMQWNMNNTLWDVTLGGNRTTIQTWKSVDDWFDPITGASGDSSVVNNGYNEYDATWQWEWPMVYEMAIDLSLCGPDPITITVISAHNSPVKDQGDGGDEMENVPVDSTQLVDYGDAPEPTYPTNLANDGARHYIVSNGPFLGAIVDAEADGQPDATTTGDDNLDGSDDEDGVVFTSPLIPGLLATVDVTASAPGLLNAWLDFNTNGSWGDTDEQIFQDVPLVAGTNSLSFTVPAGANLALTSARFRFSTTGGLTFTGLASDGEVEDYMVSVVVPVELTTFSATSLGDMVRLDWRTESESDNLGFNIYRSTTEDASYVRINDELVPGAGTTSASQNYSYLDKDIASGMTYFYMLGDVSTGGVEKRHGPIRIEIAVQTKVFRLETPLPHPIKDTATLQLTLPSAGMTRLALYDLAGREQALLLAEQLPPGNHTVTWHRGHQPGQRLPAGLYVMRLSSPAGSRARRIILAE